LRVCEASVLFPGLAGLLEALDTAGLPWGVVTNKPAHLTDPLLDRLALAARSACTVSGDTLPQRKPHPAPLLHACELAGLLPQNTVYVGDASRDIQAGQNAGMATIAAAYGYITPGDDPRRWGADLVAADTAELTQILLKAVNLGA
jgi:HAD superfamily hydrolase (TIGR01509 family)